MKNFTRLVLLSSFPLVLYSNSASSQLWQDEEIPVVLTPIRLEQSRTEVPASVSIIDRKMIVASGLRKIPELFRLIPGTLVGAKDGWNYVVSYHGTNHRDTRRMQVLIDGRSVYQAGLATIDWNDLPITIEDIERIEIVRGPSSASYGANAFLGVINIITRHPEDTEQLHLLTKRGDGRIEDYRLSMASSLLNGSIRLTLASRRDDGFDQKANGSDRRDSDNSELFNLRHEYRYRKSINNQFSLGYKQGWITDDINDPWITPMDTYTEDFFVSNKLSWDLNSNHKQIFRIDYSGQKQERELSAIIPREFIGLDQHPSEYVLADTDENQQVRRFDTEFQDTIIWNEKIQTVSGVHYQIDRVKSQTYYQGEVENKSFQLFGNAEIKWTEKLSNNIGVFWEKQSTTGTTLSPRLALNYHINKSHSIRAIYSGAVRTPDLLETSSDWIYPARNVRDPNTGEVTPGMTEGQYHCSVGANPDLDPEKIRSKEIGYYGDFQKYALQLDIKLFKDKLKELVSHTINCDSSTPSNKNYLELQGAEIEVNYRPNHTWLVRVNYAYLDSETNSHTERSMTPRNIASMLLGYNINQATNLSFAQYYTERVPIGLRNSSFSRSDFKLSHRFEWKNQSLELAYILRFRHEENGEILEDNLYEDKSRQLFTISYQY